MSSFQLPNHLRANRKRVALSQDEAAFLLGAKGGTHVSRYENFHHAPSLEMALAYEVMFKRPVSELFPGLYQEAEMNIAQRARHLIGRMNGAQEEGQSSRRRATLLELAAINNP